MNEYIFKEGFKNRLNPFWEYCQEVVHRGSLKIPRKCLQSLKFRHQAKVASKNLIILRRTFEIKIELISQKANDEAWIGLSTHYSKGYEWADSSAVNFLSWAAGEPSEVALGEADCTEMNKAGNWNNRDCNRKKLPSACSHARKWSNCQIAEGEKEPCGYAGITESVNFEDNNLENSFLDLHGQFQMLLRS
jgi:uncharacterized protein YchJ